VNIGNARVAGLQTDLKLSDYQYSLALTITYVPYIAIETPAGLVLKHVGANVLLPAMVTLWGLVTTLQGLISSYQGLLAVRFFLGLCEGGLLPGITLVMSRFYRRDQIQLRMSLLFTAASLAGAFSGLLASTILKMDGRAGHRGWQWVFILVRNSRIHLQTSCITVSGRRLINFPLQEGIFTVAFGLLSFFLLPRTPTSSRFLNEQEKEAIHAALEQDWTPDSEDEPFSWSQVIAAVTTPHVSSMQLCPSYYLD
jgi:MFS family permease